MNDAELQHLLRTLLALPQETEWVEFKHDNSNPDDIGEYVSALSNSAALHGRDSGYIVWGIDDATHAVVGTTFKPRQEKIGGQELENWLSTLLTPRINFTICGL